MYLIQQRLSKKNNRKLIVKELLTLLILCLPLQLKSHGLMESPASRTQFCGVITKPHQAENGTGQYPICKDAFVNDQEGGYSFMSVLTHAEGRKVVTPLPDNVCGFDSEVWDGEATPWDSLIEWPTNTMQSGVNEIIWNISWGPHFDDTKEFSYWITNDDFVFDANTPLTWSDFESTPFCDLQYDDTQTNANIVADKTNNKFHTFCTIPERTGRHVIYGEWGRNYYTYERFHGCIDAVFTDDNAALIDAKITATPDHLLVIGAGVITLDASASIGENLTYNWSIDATDTTLYSLSSSTGSVVQLTHSDLINADDVTVLLSVSNSYGADAATYSFEHLPTANSTWKLISPLTATVNTLTVNDNITLRIVGSDGHDNYLPTLPLIITDNNSAANVWPYELAQRINSESNDIAIGILDDNGDIVPAQTATSNNIYARIDANLAGVYLNISNPLTSNCEFTINNSWDTGYVANIKIHNKSATNIDGWQISWSLQNSNVSAGWNAEIITGATNTASNLSWNQIITANNYVEFGFNATKASGEAIEIPIVFGTVCN